MQYWVVGVEVGVGDCLRLASSALMYNQRSYQHFYQRSNQAVSLACQGLKYLFLHHDMHAQGLRCLLQMLQTQSHLHFFAPHTKI